MLVRPTIGCIAHCRTKRTGAGMLELHCLDRVRSSDYPGYNRLIRSCEDAQHINHRWGGTIVQRCTHPSPCSHAVKLKHHVPAPALPQTPDCHIQRPPTSKLRASLRFEWHRHLHPAKVYPVGTAPSRDTQGWPSYGGNYSTAFSVPTQPVVLLRQSGYTHESTTQASLSVCKTANPASACALI